MLARYNAVDIEQALRCTPFSAPFPPASNREAWEALKKSLPAWYLDGIIADAEGDARSAIPALPATLWLEYARSGQREGYQWPRMVRRNMLASLTLAECLEFKGRFLDALTDVIWAICEESAWVLPAHERQRVLPDLEQPTVDLGAAQTALELAESDALLGFALDPLIGKRIRCEAEQRCFTPYLTRHDHWWMFKNPLRPINNWNAVCNGGVVGAATYLESDLSRLAEMIARAARSLDDYLATFDPDGGSTEGPGYWCFGFGYYTFLAQLVEHRTGGLVSFMEEDIVRKAAQFPARTALSPGSYANFSDCDRTIHFIPAHLAYLSRRLDLPELMRVARNEPVAATRQTSPNDITVNDLTFDLRALSWWPSDEPAGKPVNARHDWFSQGWMIARFDPGDPGALALAVKGGHNGEMHNHNDVGSFIVHAGGESVIAELGRGRYTRAYFGPERYEHFVNSSRGHSVPVVNGCEQAAGREHAAQVLLHEADDSIDRLSLELKEAYPPQAGVQSLIRTVALHRSAPKGWIEVSDHVVFAHGPGDCESIVTTFANVEIGAPVVLRGEVGALRIAFDPALVQPSLVVTRDVDLALGPHDVSQIVFSFIKPMKEGVISLRIEPI